MQKLFFGDLSSPEDYQSESNQNRYYYVLNFTATRYVQTFFFFFFNPTASTMDGRAAAERHKVTHNDIVTSYVQCTFN